MDARGLFESRAACVARIDCRVVAFVLALCSRYEDIQRFRSETSLKKGHLQKVIIPRCLKLWQFVSMRFAAYPQRATHKAVVFRARDVDIHLMS